MQTKTVGSLTALSSIAAADKLLVEQGGISGYGTVEQVKDLVASAISNIFTEYEITAATAATVLLSGLDTAIEYTYNRNGAGTGTLELTGDIYWPDGTASTDLELEGDGQITLFYAVDKWRAKSFTDSQYSGHEYWEKDINGILRQGGYVSETVVLDTPTIGWYVSNDISKTFTLAFVDTNYSVLATSDDPSIGSFRAKDATKTTTGTAFVGYRGSSQTDIEVSFGWQAIGRFRA